MDPPTVSLSPPQQLSPLSLDPTLSVISFSTDSTMVHSQNDLDQHLDDSSKKKKRTVTFAEIDVSELDYQATKVPLEERRQWRKQAMRRKLEKKEYNCRLKLGILKASIIFLFFTLCSLIVLLATAQGTHTKI